MENWIKARNYKIQVSSQEIRFWWLLENNNGEDRVLRFSSKFLMCGGGGDLKKIHGVQFLDADVLFWSETTARY